MRHVVNSGSMLHLMLSVVSRIVALLLCVSETDRKCENRSETRCKSVVNVVNFVTFPSVLALLDSFNVEVTPTRPKE